MLLAVSLWMLLQIAFWLTSKKRPKPREWAVIIVLWSLSLTMAFIVQSDVWSSMEPMKWINSAFESPTRWLLRKV